MPDIYHKGFDIKKSYILKQRVLPRESLHFSELSKELGKQRDINGVLSELHIL